MKVEVKTWDVAFWPWNFKGELKTMLSTGLSTHEYTEILQFLDLLVNTYDAHWYMLQ